MLLFVCHANICRSPMAERLSRHALSIHCGLDPAPVTVASAGTHALVGAPMHPHAVDVLAELGVAADGFRGRQVSAELVAHADLVLTATRQERAICAALAPVAVRRVFTIRQFGRFVAALDPARLAGLPADDRLAALAREANAVRGRLQPVPAEEDDLADPVHGTAAEFRACAREIHRSLVGALALIAKT
jgi:protein-tyrosine phosphatase